MLLIDFINIGYGDAILLRDDAPQEGFSMLIDCADIPNEIEASYCNIVDFLEGEGIKALDILLLTHLHKDHTGGILALCEHIQIKALWTVYLPGKELWDEAEALQMTGESIDEGAHNLIRSLRHYLCALKRLHSQGTELVVLNEKSALWLTGMLHMEIACAAREMYDKQAAIFNALLERGETGGLAELDGFINDTSIRLRVNYCGHSLLLPGDVTAGYWVKEPPDAAHILKVPHHGHEDSLSQTLISAIRPRYAVICVSKERRECPNRNILKLLSENGVQTFCTCDAMGKSLRFILPHSEGQDIILNS